MYAEVLAKKNYVGQNDLEYGNSLNGGY